MLSYPPLIAGREAAVIDALVLDTNIVLDVWVFADLAAAPLVNGLPLTRWRWLATAAMRDELARVLAYPQIVKSLHHHQIRAEWVLRQFDQYVEIVAAPAKAAVTCKDPDDQKFIDLAVAYGTVLLSKDHAVLCMAKRLLGLGVRTGVAIPQSSHCALHRNSPGHVAL